MELGYAADLSPSEAWQTLATDRAAVLDDVRTAPEWNFVGLPDLSTLNKTVLRLSWQNWPDMTVNEGFVQALAAAGVERSQPVLLLCRSGVRSAAAAKALTAAGYEACYNIRDGFEGPANEARHRGRLAGWKVEGLPWSQG